VSRPQRSHRRQHGARLAGPLLLTAAATSVAVFATVGTMSAMGAPGAHRASSPGSKASAVKPGQNLVVNGTFEKDVAGWTTSNQGDLSRSKPGRASLGSARLTSSTPSTVVLGQTNTVRGARTGEIVKASAWVRGLRPGLSGALRLNEVAHNVHTATARTAFRLSGTDWTMVSLTYTVRHPGSALDLNVLGSQVGRGQALIVDDVALVAAPARSLLGLPTAPVPLPTVGLPTQQPGSSTATPGTPTAATTSPTPSQSASATPKPTPTTTSPTTTPTPQPPSPTGCTSRVPGDPCAGRLYYGASVEGGDPSSLESQTGTKLSLYRSYMQAGTSASAMASRASTDVANGRIPLISTKVPGSWASVAAGDQDAWLLDRIRALATIKGPVWLALHHEPAGDGSPSDWVAMQQHAHKLIKSNSSNIALVGILNGWDFKQKNGNPQAYNMPVGTGVDVMGFDSYNGWSPSNGKAWQPVADVFAPGLTIQGWGYPTLVGEYGVRTDPNNPGRAAQWLRDAYSYAAAHNFVGLSYFNSAQNSPDGSWALDSERLPAFRDSLRGAFTARMS
jgi:hypothetical protein